MLADVTGSQLVELPGRDYEYRIFISKQQFTDWVAAQVESIDYSNFKNRLWNTRGDTYHDAANHVWGAMLSVSDKYPTPHR